MSSREGIRPVTAPPKKRKMSGSNIEDVLKIMGIVTTAIALTLTYFSFSASQKWEKAKFVSLKFKEFSDNKSVQLVNQLLDYNSVTLDLFGNGKSYDITDDVLENALVVDTVNSEFTMVDYRIRQIFDDYFDQISYLNRYVKTDLVSYDEIKPYLEYQTQVLVDTSNKRKSIALKQQIGTYLYYYRYKDVIELYDNLGYEVDTVKDEP